MHLDFLLLLQELKLMVALNVSIFQDPPYIQPILCHWKGFLIHVISNTTNPVLKNWTCERIFCSCTRLPLSHCSLSWTSGAPLPIHILRLVVSRDPLLCATRHYPMQVEHDLKQEILALIVSGGNNGVDHKEFFETSFLACNLAIYWKSRLCACPCLRI